MPFTPFHFGPGGLIHALAPRRISFLSFAGANVLIDVEPLYFMVTGQDTLHRFLHTYVGATMAALATLALFAAALGLARRVWLPDVFQWQQLSLRPVAVGAVLGAYSHIVLDSVMHADMRPLAPFSQANPLFLLVSVDELQNLCLVAGVVAGAILLGRARRWRVARERLAPPSGGR
jgi:hypothetical protein